ncbi:aminopeptidase C [Enorma burkinafasonensis]|uniref:aminopeptidase C n=1 Tax=Enorma burkinafasonensis TaxID=2590867 RepID=UPI0026EBD957|nr:C1 family peptidase [Enorma burkinafasonensis]MCI7730685.1 peptidase C1 [Enorma burkinafasonensis]
MDSKAVQNDDCDRVPGGAVDPGRINALTEGFATSRANRIARNAVTSMGIAAAARDQRACRAYKDTYGVSLEAAKTVTHQHKSGRCWMFSTLNVVRARTLGILDVDDFEFSQAYTTFYEKLEKSNSFLERIIQTADRPANDRLVYHLTLHTAADGGQFMFCASILEKWGAVPKDAMPETACTLDTKYMNEVLGDILIRDAAILRERAGKGAGADELETAKADMLDEIHRFLCCCLGEPPLAFDFDFQVGAHADVDASKVEVTADGRRILRDHGVTPLEFLERYARFNPDDYIELVSMPGDTRPFGHLYGIDWFDAVVGGRPLRLLNMEMPVVEQAVIASLKGGVPAYMMCDVGKRTLRGDDDFAGVLATDSLDLEGLFDIDLSIDRGDNLDLNGTGMSHCMAFQGVQLDEAGEPVAWRVENSWGAEQCKNGYLIISRDWWRTFGGDVVVERRFVPDEVLKLRDTLPVDHVDPWDGFINYRAW